MKIFYEYELNGKKIAFHKDNKILIQLGRGRGAYKTLHVYTPAEFSRAIMHYNGINIGRGYKARIVCFELNKHILARKISA